MEHEVFVPFPAGRLREALADPVRVARAVPGLQQDASADSGGVAGTRPVSGAGADTGAGSSGAGLGPGTGPVRVAGRLKVRVAGHTITYRGAFRVIAQGDDAYAVEGDATEVRGGGAVKLALTLRLLSAEGGTTLAFGGTTSGDGRVAELPHDAVSSAGTRLLTRFAETLTTDLASRTDPTAGPAAGAAPDGEPEPAAGPALDGEGEPEPAPGPALDGEGEPELGAGPDGRGEPEPAADLGPVPEADAAADLGPILDSDTDTDVDADTPPGFEADVTPHSVGPLGDDDEFDGEDFVARAAGEVGRADAMAEAAHARRTMIGRSAEEVDHAPPRGRYAPVPPPEATDARATLRWAAPAAALALASAIALTRALRKRR
ncbi:carbon monoxide dehydrogenase [Streptomyces aureus]